MHFSRLASFFLRELPEGFSRCCADCIRVAALHLTNKVSVLKDGVYLWARADGGQVGYMSN